MSTERKITGLFSVVDGIGLFVIDDPSPDVDPQQQVNNIEMTPDSKFFAASCPNGRVYQVPCDQVICRMDPA